MLPAFLVPSSSSARRARFPAAWRRRVRRLRRHPVVFWGATLAIAVATGLFVLGLVQRAEAQAARYGSLVTVPVAAHAIDAGGVVGHDDVRLRRVPRAFLPDVRPARHPEGRTAVVALVAGEVIVDDRLAPTGLHGAAALVPAGSRALAVPVDRSTPRVGRGDRVDLLAVSENESAVVAQRALVVEVSDEAVTVAVTEAQAPVVAEALAKGSVAVALVGA